MNSIRIRLIIMILIPALLFGLVITLSASRNSRESMTEINGSKMTHQLNVYATLMETTLRDVEADGAALKRYMESNYLPQYFSTEVQTDRNAFNQDLSNFLLQLNMIQPDRNYFVYFTSSTFSMPDNMGFGSYSGDSRPDPMPQLSQSYFLQDTLNDEKAWYFKPIQTDKAAWFGPTIKYKGVKNNTLMVYSLPVVFRGKIIAVVGVDLPTEKLHAQLNEMHYYETGYPALIDASLRVISHPTLLSGKTASEQLGPDYQYIDQALNQKDYGQLTYKWADQRDKILYFKKLQNGWKLVLTAYSNEVMRSNMLLSQRLIIMVLICLLLSILFSFIFGNMICKPIIQLVEDIRYLRTHQSDAQISDHLLNRKDQFGRISRLLNQRYQLLAENLKTIHHYTSNLHEMVEQKHLSLIEANEVLASKKDLISAQQVILKSQNEYLEHSIQTMLNTQNKLIEQEKLASFSEIINGIASEIKPTLHRSSQLVEQLDLSITKQTRQMLRSEYSRRAFQETFEACKKNNRRLIGNLIFSKDIIDYIKDLTASSGFKEISVIELGEYLEKCRAHVESIPLEYSIKLLFHIKDPVYLQMDATKLLHLITSLLIHIITGVQSSKYPIFIKIQHKVIGDDLLLSILDNTLNNEQDYMSLNTNLWDPSSHHLGLSMIKLLMKEAFSGSLSIHHSIDTPGTRYELVFPHALFK